MKPVDPLTLDRIRLATSRSAGRLHAAFKKASSAYADANPSVRKDAMECRSCFYLDAGMIAGRSFTTYVCAGCKHADRYPSTAVPVLCHACADLYELCRRCCADLECRDRTRVEAK